jgi:hypothetical protein
MNLDPSREPSRYSPPSYAEVVGAYADIVRHNDDHTGFGAVFPVIIRAMIEEGDFIDPNDDSEYQNKLEKNLSERIANQLRDSVVEGDMDGELQDILHGDIFTRVGLKMNPSGSFMSTLQGEPVSSVKLMPDIEIVTMFSDFLGTISPEEIEIGDNELILDVLSVLRDKIARCYSPNSRNKVPEHQRPMLEQIGEDALRTFITIEPELQRLGLDADSLRNKYEVKPTGKGYLFLGKNATAEQKAEKAAHDEYNSAQRTIKTQEALTRYVTYWGRGLLPEYLDAGHYLLSPENQGFGPAHWHKDGGQRYWKHALESVARLTGDERTRAFGEEVRDGLVASVDAALVDIHTSTEGNIEDAWRLDLGNNLQNIRNMLTGEEYDAQSILDYIES